MPTLIVTLSSQTGDATAGYDYVLTQDGKSVAAQSRAALALLPQVGNGGEIVLLVPAQRLSWHSVRLPKGSLGRRYFQDGGSARLRAVLEGLLEDRLLDETERLHFALSPQASTDAPVWVAVCERSWLHSALQAFEQAGRAVSRVVPEFVPENPSDVLHVVGDAASAQVVFSTDAGVTVWPLSRASTLFMNWPPTQEIVAEPAVAALAEELFKRAVTVQHGSQRRMQAINSNWDLAQFDLANSGRDRMFRQVSTALTGFLRAPRWRPARWAALALLLVNLVGLNALAWRERSELESQRRAIAGVLTSTFPQVRLVIDPAVQMSREVAILQQASGAATVRDMDLMMSVFGSVASLKNPPTAIDFAGGELRLKGLKLSSEETAAISFKLKPQGYEARADGESVVVKQGPGP